MDTVKELKVRELAAESLGVDLSDIDSKKLVREVVEAYLLSACDDDRQGRVHGDRKENTNENLVGVGNVRVNGGGLKDEKNANLDLVGERKENGEQPPKASERDTDSQLPANRSGDDGVKFLCKRGVYFEITYSSLIVDIQVRRQVISNAKLLMDWTRAKNLIVSSAAPSVLEFRGPNDVANLLSLLGLAVEHAKVAISKKL